MRTYAFARCDPYPSTIYDLTANKPVKGQVVGYDVSLITAFDGPDDIRRPIAHELVKGSLWAIAIPRLELSK